MKNSNLSTDLGKTIGFWTATSVVVGIVIGSGVFVKPSKVLLQTGASSIAIWAWIVGGLMTIASGLTIAEVSSRIPKTGGIFSYIEEIYGKRLGFLCGWVLTFIYGPGLMGALGLYFASLLQPFLGYGSSWVTPTAIFTILFLMTMNILGTKWGGRIQTATTAIKLIPIAAICIFGLIRGQENIFSTIDVDPVMLSFGSAVLSTLWAYDGWILVGNVAGEMKNVQRDLPRAIIFGLSLVAVAYLGVNLAIFHVMPIEQISQLGDRTASGVAEMLFGPMGGSFISIGILISIFGCLNGSILSSPRVPFAMAQGEGLRGNQWIAKVHPQFQTPMNAIIMQVSVGIAMVLLAKPDQITDFAIFSVYLFYTLAFFGLFILRKKNPNHDGYKTPLYPIVPLIAVLSSIYILGSTVVDQTKIAAISFAITLAGIPAYYLLKRKA